MVIETVVQIAVIIMSTSNIALWAFRPNSYSVDPRARRITEGLTVAWVILLPAAGGAALGFGWGTWQGLAVGGVALACWTVVILALRKRRRSRTAQSETDRQTDDRLLTLLDEPAKAEVNDLLARRKRVAAIRRIREMTDLPLPAAARMADLLRRGAVRSEQ
jgi:hypothetical protein